MIQRDGYSRIQPDLNTSFFNNTFRIKGDFTFQNTDVDVFRKRVQVPYSNKPGVTAYVGTTTNDLTFELRTTRYMASNLYGEYENTFADAHYLKFMAGIIMSSQPMNGFQYRGTVSFMMMPMILT